MATRVVSEEFNRINDIWLDEERTGKLIRAWSNWDAATPQEQHLAWLFFTKIMNHLQTMCLMWQAGTSEEPVYLAEERVTCQFLATSAGKQWWAIMRNGHAEDFSARINSALSTSSYIPVTEQMPFWNEVHWPR